MALISTSALRKLTILVLLVATVSFGAAEIHKRFFSPTQPPARGGSEVGRFELIESITGTFQRWENIPNSSDRYAILTDPEAGEPFPKIRVGFEFSPLFTDGGEDATVFAVVKSEDDYDVLGYLHEFTPEEVSKLVKQGDPIKIYLEKKIEKEENAKDGSGNFLAHWLMIRRKNGKDEVEQELGRRIEEPEKP